MKKHSKDQDREKIHDNSTQAMLDVIDEHTKQAVREARRIELFGALVLFFVGLVALGIAFAISCAKVSSARERLVELSNSNHGSTLDKFVARVHKESNVCYALFDSDGDKLFEYTEDYSGLGMYDTPDWPETEEFFSLTEVAGIHTEVHWHSRLVPTSIHDDLYVSAQTKPKQLIIMEYDKTHYFTPGSSGWPGAEEMLIFQRRNSRNPASRVLDRDYFAEMLEHFDIQYEVVPVD